MFPWLSSMHFVNWVVAPLQLSPQVWFCWLAAELAWSTGSAAAAEEPPPKREEMPPPITWPTEEPMATPLDILLVSRMSKEGRGKRGSIRSSRSHLRHQPWALRGRGTSGGSSGIRGTSLGTGVGGCWAGLLLLGWGGGRASGNGRARGGASGTTGLARHFGFWFGRGRDSTSECVCVVCGVEVVRFEVERCCRREKK